MTNVGVLLHTEKTLGKGPEALRMALADAGHADPPWAEVTRSKKAPKQVRRLLDAGIDRLLVWGGDGTVRRCIDTIVAEEAKVEVGILPAGTANLLATAMTIPTDLDQAVDIALNGRPRPTDIGVVNGEAFAVMAGTGFDAFMIRDADEGKDRLGRLAYIRAGARNLDLPSFKAKVRVDGKKWFDGRAGCVLIGNVGRVFGGIDVFPDALSDDAHLDVGVITAEGRADWMRVGMRAALGRIDSSPFVRIVQGSSISIKLDRTMPWQLDGGDRPRTKRLDISILPGRLPIMVPAS